MEVLLTNSVGTSGHNIAVSILSNNGFSMDAIESGVRCVESDPNAAGLDMVDILTCLEKWSLMLE